MATCEFHMDILQYIFHARFSPFFFRIFRPVGGAFPNALSHDKKLICRQMWILAVRKTFRRDSTMRKVCQSKLYCRVFAHDTNRRCIHAINAYSNGYRVNECMQIDKFKKRWIRCQLDVSFECGTQLHLSDKLRCWVQLCVEISKNHFEIKWIVLIEDGCVEHDR